MNTIIKNETHKLREEIVSYLEFAHFFSELAIKSLKKNDVSIALEVIDKEDISKLKMDLIIDESMYILTQHPLGKELRKVIAYQSISKIIDKIIHNSTKIAKFEIKFKSKPAKNTFVRINKTYLIFQKSILSLLDIIKKDKQEIKSLKEIIKNYPAIKDAVSQVRKELEKSLSKKEQIGPIKERLFIFSICEAIKRNTEMIFSIIEYFLFIEDGKNHSYIR